MDSNKLKEIKNNIAVLPVLRERADKLCTRIRDAEREVNTLLNKYKEECFDVEQLKGSSFSAFLLKAVGKYEGKLQKEEKEMISAKLSYDRACQNVEELRAELHDMEERIIALKDQERIYKIEIKKREQLLLSRMNTEVSEQYIKLEQERDYQHRQLIEMDEVLHVANRVKNTARNAMSHLDSAESWATYDVWFKSGIFTHMAKYDHIDQAEHDFNRLSSQLRELKKELSDIDITDTPGLTSIDSTTRAIDFWFDNIFTDIKVRDKIRSNTEQVRSVYGSVSSILTNVDNKKKKIDERLKEIEYLQNKLILSL